MYMKLMYICDSKQIASLRLRSVQATRNHKKDEKFSVIQRKSQHHYNEIAGRERQDVRL